MQNIYGTYLMTRSFLPLLLQGSGKTIINLTSIAAHFLVNGASAYSTGKLAMLRFCEFTNVEYGAQGILAYTVHPGGVATELATNVMPKAMQNGPSEARNTKCCACVAYMFSQLC